LPSILKEEPSFKSIVIFLKGKVEPFGMPPAKNIVPGGADVYNFA
jgi:hypothetical protein